MSAPHSRPLDSSQSRVAIFTGQTKLLAASLRGIAAGLEVDGGVKANNIGELAALGADTFVAGSAIFNQPDYRAVIDEMRSEIAKATA